jgi:outer membrane lipoprotein carrier protein
LNIFTNPDKWDTQVITGSIAASVGHREERDLMDHLKIGKRQSKIVVMATLLLVIIGSLMPRSAVSAADATVEKIVNGVEARYNVAGFTADFDQESILKAMAVTDTASGRLMVRQPGKMRWEYQVPEIQTIITDGKKLWIYRPDENQVLVGKAPELFGKGKGAGFLANIKSIRKGFRISLVPSGDPDLYRLKLVPNKSSVDLMEVRLDIVKKTFDLIRIITFNVYGDETRIELKHFNFDNPPPASLFRFEVPEGADVVQMNQ